MSKPQTHRHVAVGVLASLALLTACSSGTPEPSASTPSGDDPAPGGSITIGWTADPACLDPQLTGANLALSISRQLVDSLTDQDPATGELVPWLATEWDVNDDATSFDFVLRDDATFSDGTPVDAEAVKANFESILENGARASLGAGYLTGYQDTVVSSPTELTVVFDAPNAQFLQATSTMSLGLLSLGTLAETPDDRCQGAVTGSGPFTLEDYTQNQSTTIVRRDGYSWGSSLWETQGEALLESITFQVIPEASTRVGALTGGQLDAALDIAPQDEARLTDAGFALVSRTNPGIPTNWTVNVGANEALGEKEVRQAIQHGIDRQELIDTVLTDSYTVATGFLASTTPGYVDQSDVLAFDPGLSEDLLDAAGWVPGADGIREKDGNRLSFTLSYHAWWAANDPILELVQQQLADIGVEFLLGELPAADIAAKFSDRTYDAIWYGQTRADPDVLRLVLSVDSGNRANLPEPGLLEDLLQQQTAVIDAAARQQLVEQALEELGEQAYIFPIVEQLQILAVSPAVHRLQFEASSRLQLHDTWIRQ